MFYSIALSVRRILLKIKKKTEQFEGGGEKEKVAGGYEGAKKQCPNNWTAPGRKRKSARRRRLVSCSGTLLLLDDEVIDKLFGF